MTLHVLQGVLVALWMLSVTADQHRTLLSTDNQNNKVGFMRRDNYGILMCEDLCLNVVGCVSYAFRSSSLSCKLRNVRTEGTSPDKEEMYYDVNPTAKGYLDHCANYSQGGKYIATKLHSWKCIKAKRFDVQRIETEVNSCSHAQEHISHVTMSIKYTDIIYGHGLKIYSTDTLMSITVNHTCVRKLVLKIPNMARHKSSLTVRLQGMATGRCIVNTDSCIYFVYSVFDKNKGRALNSPLNVIAFTEPDPLKRRHSVQPTITSLPTKSRYGYVSLAVGHNMNLYILQRAQKTNLLIFTRTEDHYKLYKKTWISNSVALFMQVFRNGKKILLKFARKISLVQLYEDNMKKKWEKTVLELRMANKIFGLDERKNCIILVQTKFPFKMKSVVLNTTFT